MPKNAPPPSPHLEAGRQEKLRGGGGGMGSLQTFPPSIKLAFDLISRNFNHGSIGYKQNMALALAHPILWFATARR